MSAARAVGSGEALVLIGGESPVAPIAWARVECSTGQVKAHGLAGQDDKSAPAAIPSRTVLVLPGADARVKRIELPARTEAQARAAASFLFEGELATTEGVHYAVGEAQDGAGHRLVAAIAETRLAEWLEYCRAMGADPHLVVLDFTLWPVEPGAIEVVETPNRTIVAGGALGGFSIEPALAPTLFARWVEQAKAGVLNIHYSGASGDVWAARASGASFQVRANSDPIAVLAGAAVAAPAFAPNLRQGSFAPAAQSPPPWRLWRFAAFLALLAVLLQIGSMTIAGWRDQQAAAATLAAAERDFRVARPDVRRIVNLRAQSAALVNAMEQSQSHPVLAVTEPIIRALQTQPLVRLDELRHEAPGRTVRLRLSAPQAPLLEQATAELRRLGLSVEARELQPHAGRYAIELSLESPS